MGKQWMETWEKKFPIPGVKPMRVRFDLLKADLVSACLESGKPTVTLAICNQVRKYVVDESSLVRAASLVGRQICGVGVVEDDVPTLAWFDRDGSEDMPSASEAVVMLEKRWGVPLYATSN